MTVCSACGEPCDWAGCHDDGHLCEDGEPVESDGVIELDILTGGAILDDGPFDC